MEKGNAAAGRRVLWYCVALLLQAVVRAELPNEGIATCLTRKGEVHHFLEVAETAVGVSAGALSGGDV